MKKQFMKAYIKLFSFLAGSLLPFISFAQEQQPVQTPGYFSNPLFNTLLAIIIVLAIMVMALSGALKNIVSSDMFVEKIKKNREPKEGSAPKGTGLMMLFLFLSLSAFSQEKVLPSANDAIGGLDKFTFYILIVVIGLELLVLGILFNTFKNILGEKKKESLTTEAKPKTKTILDKLNDTVDIAEEGSIMLDHDYDGIRELDNNLPPWWKYGFYLTILIAVIYMINYHVTMTAPLQKEEYTNSIKKAEAEIAGYMKNSADNVDETTVKMLKETSDLAGGKDLFITNCATCHGKLGEGGVGPNLTDEYWLHSGTVKEIFKTIKYGWPDKGMKAWKEDFSPMQIAQITSFVKTLKGTDPPKQKDKQGELFIEQVAPADSSIVKVDSTKILSSGLPK
jgi:cytochrome c oxidase cbb3-type subunit 3